MKHLLAILILATVPASLQAQLVLHSHPTATTARIVTPKVADSLTLSVSPSTLSFSLAPHARSNGGALTLTIAWNFSQNRSTSVYAYFNSSTAALSGSSPAVNIPSSAVYAVFGTTSAYFTGTSPFSSGNSAVTLLSNLSLSGNSTGAGTLTLYIDCTNQTQLPAATYTGVVFIQAQAF